MLFDMTRVSTEQGIVEGLEVDGLHHFRNVPYAAPPFGANRFEPPRPPMAWDGIRDATKAGPNAPQPTLVDVDPWAPLFGPRPWGEDCLTLEVWTPDPGAARLPVMVFIHGGGFISGAGSLPGHTGRTFARDGIVHVGINYRVGIEGFAYLGDGRDNLGLRDQQFALEWVQRNIAAFGGDPGNVTIFGQSAGAVSTLLHTVMPGSYDLHHRAISQSGSTIVTQDISRAESFTKAVAKRLKVAPTAEAMRSVPLAQAVEATKAVELRFVLGSLYGSKDPIYVSPFRPVHGTPTLPAPAFSVAGTKSRPLIAGTCQNETAGFINAIAGLGPGGPLVRRGLFHALDLDDEVKHAYASGPRRITDRNALLEAAWTDWAFRMPTIRQLELRRDPSWLYELRWKAIPGGMGCEHSLDMPFVRDDLASTALMEPDAANLFKGAPQSVADAMHGAFVAFAKTGDPGWAPYTPDSRATMVFDTESRVIDDAAGVERIAWANRW